MLSLISIRAILGLILIGMGIQDFKFRAISWYLFPLLTGCLLLINPSFSINACLINLGFIAFVFVLLTGWFSLREGSMVNLTQRHLGIGDILFLLCLAFFFSPVNFFLFYLSSLLLVAIGTGLYLILAKPENFSIPLAGLQGLVLIVMLTAGWIWNIDISNTDFLPDFLFNAYERG
uniref:hypothetical protein n=1 Tax=Pedobacter schmidteae TaxID=2201271 RepID=UPI0013CF039E|nr:hypothetical protein [Pedobacter schmidteae]